MIVASRDAATFIISFTCILALIIVGRPLLVPLAFAILLWAVLNAMTEALVRIRVPRWLAWTTTFALFVLAFYLIVRIVGNETAAIAQQAPAMGAKLNASIIKLLAPLKLGVGVSDFFSRADLAGYLGTAASSLGMSLFEVLEVLIYLGFLIAQQDEIVARFATMQHNHALRAEGLAVLAAIARQIQAYLGVCTIMSAITAAVTYGLCIYFGIPFAGFWALVLFVLTYIPTVGAFGVVFPALMAFVQLGTLEVPIFIAVVLGGLHFVLLDIVEPKVLGQTLNLDPFIIIIALTFWGLVWGIGGLFLAVPVTGAIAIVCSHVEGLKWINTVLAAAPPHLRRRHRHRHHHLQHPHHPEPEVQHHHHESAPQEHSS